MPTIKNGYLASIKIDDYATYEEWNAARELARRNLMIQGLRDLADMLENNPRLARPMSIYAQTWTSQEDARSMREGIHGWEKYNAKDSGTLDYTKSLTPELENYEGVCYVINVSKSGNCRKVQVGTRHVEAVEAHDEPVYEWDCTDSDEAVAVADLDVA